MQLNTVMFLFALAASAGFPAASVVAAPVEAPTSASADGRDLAGLEHRWAIPLIFNSFDTNKDGFLSREEAGVSSQIAGQFDRLDKNGDGRLSVDELQAASPDGATSTARRGNWPQGAEKLLREQLTALGVDPWPGTAEELGALLRADIERYGKIARSAGLSKQ